MTRSLLFSSEIKIKCLHFINISVGFFDGRGDFKGGVWVVWMGEIESFDIDDYLHGI